MGTQLERGVRYHGRASDPTDLTWYAPGRAPVTSATTGGGGGTRDPSLWPGAVDAFWNIPAGSGAIYESSAATATAQALSCTPTMNSKSYSVSYNVAAADAPITLVTSLDSTTTWFIQIPTSAQAVGGTDGWTTFVQSDHFTAYDGYGMVKNANGSWTTKYDLIQYDLRGDGLERGRRASNIGLAFGLIQPEELAAGDIPHAVVMSLPYTVLQRPYVWPAHGEDNPKNFTYGGNNPMGSVFGIPPSVNLASLGLSTDGMTLGKALQDFCVVVGAQGQYASIIAHPKCETDATLKPRYLAMKADFQTKLFSRLRRITNNDPGAFIGTPGLTRTPIDISGVLGGGTRRRASAPPLSV